jgi:hypothetical protein
MLPDMFGCHSDVTRPLTAIPSLILCRRLRVGSTLALAMVLCTACAARGRIDTPAARIQAACQSALPPSLPRASAPHAVPVPTELPVAWDVLSPIGRRVATQLGLAPHLQALALTVDSSAFAHREGDARVLADVQAYVQAASMVTAAVAAELDCEEEFADQIATRLAASDSRRSARLTAGAILAAAAGAVASAVLLARDNNGRAFEIVGMAVAAIETTFGVMLFRSEGAVHVAHRDNLLVHLLEVPNSSRYFPEPTWQFLRSAHDSAAGALSRRELLLREWEREGLVHHSAGKTRPHPKQPYFSEGGSYTAQQLRQRADMLDQTEAVVNLLLQELSVLSVELTRLRR